MSNLRNITYGIESGCGQVVSRVGNEYAWPILEFEKIGQDGNFNKPLTFKLEKINVHAISHSDFTGLIHTRKIPNEIKNIHRKFWGMKPLKGKNRWE